MVGWSPPADVVYMQQPIMTGVIFDSVERCYSTCHRHPSPISPMPPTPFSVSQPPPTCLLDQFSTVILGKLLVIIIILGLHFNGQKPKTMVKILKLCYILMILYENVGLGELGESKH